MFMIPNPFRGNDRALHNKKGFHNPCSVCWRWRCKNCLVYLLADFSAVLRTNKKMSRDFEKYYNEYYAAATGQTPKKGKNKKGKKHQLKAVK